jgi:hypothetical protein
MLYELIGDRLTDFIAPLEERCGEDDVFTRFGRDLRVRCALEAMLEHAYDLEPGWSNICDRLSFLDDVWVSTYLLKSTGSAKGAEGIRQECLRFFDPFTSYNPITRCFAYCEYIDDSANSHDLSAVIESMDHYLGHCKDAVTKRMYPVLKRISGKKLEYLERKEEYHEGFSSEIKESVPSGDYAD